MTRTLLLCLALVAGFAAEGSAASPLDTYTSGTITASVSHLDFYFPHVQGVIVQPVTQTFTVTSNGPQSVQFNLSMTAFSSSFTVTVSQYETPAVITVRANPTYLIADAELMTIQPASGASLTIPMNLEYWPSPAGTAGLTPAPASVQWTMPAGGTAPSTNLSLSTPLTPYMNYPPSVKAIPVSDGNWLLVNGGYSTLNPLGGQLILSCRCNGLGPGAALPGW